jgi:hypothetical protein
MFAPLGAFMGVERHKKAAEQEEMDRDLAAQTAKYSWITGMKPQGIRRAPSYWDMVGQGFTSGMNQDMQVGGKVMGAMGGGG